MDITELEQLRDAQTVCSFRSTAGTPEGCRGAVEQVGFPANANAVHVRDIAGNVHVFDARHMARDLVTTEATAEQLAEARNWIADAYPANPLDMSDEHPVYEDPAEYVQRFTDRHYPGGWSAFVADMA